MALACRDEVFLVCIATVHTQTENSALKKTSRKVERTDLACLRPPPARCRMKKEQWAGDEKSGEGGTGKERHPKGRQADRHPEERLSSSVCAALAKDPEFSVQHLHKQLTTT